MSRLIFTMLIAAIAITSTDLPVLASPSGATAMTQMPASASSDKKRDNKHNKKHDKDRDRGHRNDHGRKPHDRRPGQPPPPPPNPPPPPRHKGAKYGRVGTEPPQAGG